MLNMSTMSTNDQGKSFWDLVYGSVNQVLADHRPVVLYDVFLVTLQRIFNSCLKKFQSFSVVISDDDYICSGCKNMVSQKCAVFIGPPCISAEAPPQTPLEKPHCRKIQ